MEWNKFKKDFSVTWIRVSIFLVIISKYPQELKHQAPISFAIIVYFVFVWIFNHTNIYNWLYDEK